MWRPSECCGVIDRLVLNVPLRIKTVGRLEMRVIVVRSVGIHVKAGAGGNDRIAPFDVLHTGSRETDWNDRPESEGLLDKSSDIRNLLLVKTTLPRIVVWVDLLDLLERSLLDVLPMFAAHIGNAHDEISGKCVQASRYHTIYSWSLRRQVFHLPSLSLTSGSFKTLPVMQGTSRLGITARLQTQQRNIISPVVARRAVVRDHALNLKRPSINDTDSAKRVNRGLASLIPRASTNGESFRAADNAMKGVKLWTTDQGGLVCDPEISHAVERVREDDSAVAHPDLKDGLPSIGNPGIFVPRRRPVPAPKEVHFSEAT
ncbi:Phenylacetate [Hortaea werneckii]|nr:Phenylacetate [Hortaea werneckii]